VVLVMSYIIPSYAASVAASAEALLREELIAETSNAMMESEEGIRPCRLEDGRIAPVWAGKIVSIRLLKEQGVGHAEAMEALESAAWRRLAIRNGRHCEHCEIDAAYTLLHGIDSLGRQW
jgi:hypothetical protein